MWDDFWGQIMVKEDKITLPNSHHWSFLIEKVFFLSIKISPESRGGPGCGVGPGRVVGHGHGVGRRQGMGETGPSAPFPSITIRRQGQDTLPRWTRSWRAGHVAPPDTLLC